ncbi:hypothetical protein [Nonomuraea sp. SYSU D8015]|uniref:hypothetical protein n=1 Tax=Nonomuraea sp. SYSU D8015 TaxID=2593644 RepID=UPI001660A073|nr:hypothetical protein [Nonomuraea sp. SYSU D8015]
MVGRDAGLNAVRTLCNTSCSHDTYALTPRRGGFAHFRGCTIDPEPVTATTAAKRLRRKPVTIRQWARRYAARQLGTIDRAVYYDWDDLATIDGCMARGEDVPATPEGRDRLRAELRARWRNAA